MNKLEHWGVLLAGLGAGGFLLGYVFTMLRAYSHIFVGAVIAGIALWIIGMVF